MYFYLHNTFQKRKYDVLDCSLDLVDFGKICNWSSFLCNRMNIRH